MPLWENETNGSGEPKGDLKAPVDGFCKDAQGDWLESTGEDSGPRRFTPRPAFSWVFGIILALVLVLVVAGTYELCELWLADPVLDAYHGSKPRLSGVRVLIPVAFVAGLFVSQHCRLGTPARITATSETLRLAWRSRPDAEIPWRRVVSARQFPRGATRFWALTTDDGQQVRFGQYGLTRQETKELAAIIERHVQPACGDDRS